MTEEVKEELEKLKKRIYKLETEVIKLKAKDRVYGRR